jgi:uncharacterized membrane protein
MTYIIVVVISILGFAFFAGHAIIESFSKTEVRYNCDLAEISPDIPLAAKKQCRELRNKNEQRNIKGDSITSGR